MTSDINKDQKSTYLIKHDSSQHTKSTHLIKVYIFNKTKSLHKKTKNKKKDKKIVIAPD
jgi:hypothetical protein